MAAETDAFVVATFALWAGDVAYAEELLREYSPPHATPPLYSDSIRSPEAVVRAIGALRLRQLWHKRGEFRRIVNAQVEEVGDLIGEPTTLQTEHLRATLWRRDERQFLLQGYLKQLKWEPRLFELARVASSRAYGRHEEQKRALLPEAEAKRPLGASWSIEGTLFIQVDVTDLGQIEANGIWTKLDLPQTAEPILTPFINLLNDLDRPVDKSELRNEITE